MHALLLATPLLLSCHLTESLDTGVDVVYPEQTGEARNTGVTTHWGALDRTIDLSDYGVDLDKVFNRLLGPSGIVNQIALTAVTQSFVILAYIIGGKSSNNHHRNENVETIVYLVIAFNQLKLSNSGGNLDGVVSFFEPFLNNQVKRLQA